MDDTLRIKAEKVFNDTLISWNDLPSYVYTKKYKEAFFNEYLEKRIAMGCIEFGGDIIWALDHETGGKMPYFPFDRDTKAARRVVARASR